MNQASATAQMVARTPPGTAYYSGFIQDAPGSAVLLAVREDRAMHGTAFQGTKTWALGVSNPPSGPQAAAAGGGSGGGATGGPLTSRLVAPGETSGKGPFQCDTKPGSLGELAQRLGGGAAANASAAAAAAATIAQVGAALRASSTGLTSER